MKIFTLRDRNKRKMHYELTDLTDLTYPND